MYLGVKRRLAVSGYWPKLQPPRWLVKNANRLRQPPTGNLFFFNESFNVILRIKQQNAKQDPSKALYKHNPSRITIVSNRPYLQLPAIIRAWSKRQASVCLLRGTF
jgi:hypothetical protein